MELKFLRQFSYKETFSMSYDNVLIFSGSFINASNQNLYIPFSNNHSAITLNIASQTIFGPQNND